MGREKQCMGCRSMIDSRARICPHCRTKQGQSRGLLGCVTVLVLGFVLVVVFNPMKCDTASKPPDLSPQSSHSGMPSSDTADKSAQALLPQPSLTSIECDFTPGVSDGYKQLFLVTFKNTSNLLFKGTVSVSPLDISGEEVGGWLAGDIFDFSDKGIAPGGAIKGNLWCEHPERIRAFRHTAAGEFYAGPPLPSDCSFEEIGRCRYKVLGNAMHVVLYTPARDRPVVEKIVDGYAMRYGGPGGHMVLHFFDNKDDAAKYLAISREVAPLSYEEGEKRLEAFDSASKQVDASEFAGYVILNGKVDKEGSYFAGAGKRSLGERKEKPLSPVKDDEEGKHRELVQKAQATVNELTAQLKKFDADNSRISDYIKLRADIAEYQQLAKAPTFAVKFAAAREQLKALGNITQADVDSYKEKRAKLVNLLEEAKKSLRALGRGD